MADEKVKLQLVSIYYSRKSIRVTSPYRSARMYWLGSNVKGISV